jgi:ankyrin repeat protein
MSKMHKIDKPNDCLIHNDIFTVVLPFMKRKDYGTCMRLSKNIRAMCYKHLNFSEEEWDIAFNNACKLDRMDVAEWLTCNPSIDCSVALISATWYNKPKLLRIVLNHDGVSGIIPTIGTRALLHACTLGYEDIVYELLKHDGLDMNKTYQNCTVPKHACENCTVLKHACENGHTSIVDILLRDGRVDPTDENKFNSICDAISRGHAEVVERLMQDNRVSASVPLDDILLLACTMEETMVAEKLLKYKKDNLCACTNPVDIRSMIRSHHVTSLLLKHGALYPSYHALEAACALVDHESLKVLLEDPRVDKKVVCPQLFVYACKKGMTDLVDMFIHKYDVDPSYNKQEGLIEACKQNIDGGHLVRIILRDKRIDPGLDDQMALRVACIHGSRDVVRILLRDPRVDVTINNNEIPILTCGLKCKDDMSIDLFKSGKINPLIGLNEMAISLIHNNRYNPLAVLLEHPMVKPHHLSKTLLKEARDKAHVMVYSTLTKSGKTGPIVGDYNEILAIAVEGQSHYLDMLLKCPDVSLSDDIAERALGLAILNNRKTVVDTLLSCPGVVLPRCTWKNLARIASNSQNYNGEIYCAIYERAGRIWHV